MIFIIYITYLNICLKIIYIIIIYINIVVIVGHNQCAEAIIYIKCVYKLNVLSISMTSS